MNEKTDLGHGAYLRPDGEPRDSKYHKRIVSVKPIPHTRSGHWVWLECGHKAHTYGDLAHANGLILCEQCIAENE